MHGLNNASKTPIAAITLLVREKAFSQRLLIETKIKSWPVLNFNTTFATKSASSRHPTNSNPKRDKIGNIPTILLLNHSELSTNTFYGNWRCQKSHSFSIGT
jgi:hypothetical protein